MKKCSEVMSGDPVTGLPSNTVEDIAQLMKAENVGPVPIVESQESRKLIGIVTDRDLAIKVVAQGRDPKSTRVEEVMTRELVTCHPGDELQRALDAMGVHQLRRMPVVDSRGAIVGIISQADLALRADAPKKTAELVAEVSLPTLEYPSIA